MDTAPIVTSVLSGNSPLVAFMLLVILGLCWFAKYMLSELKEERLENRKIQIQATAVMSEVKEIFRAALNKQ